MPATIDRFGISRLRKPALLYRLCCCFRGCLKCPNLRVQTAFVTRCLVLVHQAFSRHRIQHRNCRGIGSRSGSFITRVNRCNYTLDLSTHHGTHASVAGTSCFRLTSTFFCLGGVRQVSLLKKLKIEKLKIQPNSIVRALTVVNQSIGCRSQNGANTCALAIKTGSVVQADTWPAEYFAVCRPGALH